MLRATSPTCHAGQTKAVAPNSKMEDAFEDLLTVARCRPPGRRHLQPAERALAGTAAGGVDRAAWHPGRRAGHPGRQTVAGRDVARNRLPRREMRPAFVR